jgi:hypothetical protein
MSVMSVLQTKSITFTLCTPNTLEVCAAVKLISDYLLNVGCFSVFLRPIPDVHLYRVFFFLFHLKVGVESRL